MLLGIRKKKERFKITGLLPSLVQDSAASFESRVATYNL
jgi:hypothetical protein